MTIEQMKYIKNITKDTLKEEYFILQLLIKSISLYTKAKNNLYLYNITHLLLIDFTSMAIYMPCHN